MSCRSSREDGLHEVRVEPGGERALLVIFLPVAGDRVEADALPSGCSRTRRATS
jgi:hypothetical protein